jgi:hypothetical protein
MSIFFRPDLFDAEQFQALIKGDIFRRIRASIVPGRHFSAALDGYDITSFRVEEESDHPVGSLVDYLFERLPLEAAANPELPKLIPLLGRLTERYGNLADETDHIFLGYLTAAEAATLRGQLERCGYETVQTFYEKSALMKILSVAEEHGTGLILSQS